MKIVKAQQYDSSSGWVIFVKEFEEKDLHKLLSLMRKLELARDHAKEKFFYEINGNKLVKNRISRNFQKDGVSISFDYYLKEKIFVASWKSDYFDGQEFISLFLSN